jgi:hypothetical protein
MFWSTTPSEKINIFSTNVATGSFCLNTIAVTYRSWMWMFTETAESSGMWCHIRVTNGSDETAASLFRLDNVTSRRASVHIHFCDNLMSNVNTHLLQVPRCWKNRHAVNCSLLSNHCQPPSICAKRERWAGSLFDTIDIFNTLWN